MYIFAGLVMVYNFGSAENEAGLTGGAAVIERIVFSLQSIIMVRLSYPTLQKSPLGPLFLAGVRRSDLQKQFTADGIHVRQLDYLTQLSQQIRETPQDDYERKAISKRSPNSAKSTVWSMVSQKKLSNQ